MSDKLATSLLYGDWIDCLGDLLRPDEKAILANMPQVEIASLPLLEAAIGVRRARELLKQAEILPEIDKNGHRRCVYEKNGKRCTRYAPIPVCDKHFERASMLSAHFKSKTLRDEYNKLLNSPYKMHLDSELSMMRLMLGVLVGKLNDGAVTFEHIVAVTTMCEKISGVVDKMAKMNAITPETIDKMMANVVDVLALHVPPDKLPLIAAEITKLSPKVNACDITYEPGQQLSEDEAPISVHKRALLQISAQLKDAEAEVL